VVENVGSGGDQNDFLWECWYSTDMIPGITKDVLMYIVPQRFGPVVWGGRVFGSFSIKKSW
jgi:hypothetical protein